MAIKIGNICMPDGKIKSVAMEISENMESDIDKRFMNAKRIERRIGLCLSSGKISTLGKGKKCSAKSQFYEK